MKLFEQARIRIHHHLLSKELRSFQVKRKSMDMDQATSIGILFDATQPEERELVFNFAKQLKKEDKKVRLLAFFDNNIKTENLTYPYLNRKSIDWAFRPKGKEAQEFSEKPFDLLINLSIRNVLPLDYIAARSKASFRVGPITDNTHCYDLMIDLKNKKDLSSFLQQVTHYLKKTNPANLQTA